VGSSTNRQLGDHTRRTVAFDEEGRTVDQRSTTDQIVAERGLVYQAFLFGALLFAGVVGGAWIAGTASASFASLPVAVITAVVLAVLVGWQIAARRR
jgi:hypothetical protein